MSSATTTFGQLLRPFPQFNGVQYAGAGNFASTYNSLQATLQKRFNGGGTVLAAYTWAKLLSNTDTITSWLEPGGKGGVQDWNNLAKCSAAPYRQLCARPSVWQEPEIRDRSPASCKQGHRRLGT
jgi:hypothetical protein